MEPISHSSSTLQGSSATLARGMDLLDAVAALGVVKTEPDEEEEEMLKQIEAQIFMQQSSRKHLNCNHPETCVL